MSIPEGPFAYKSEQPPLPLSEDEEAALAFAACGVTGFALADLSYGPGQGGSMIAGLVGRTVSSGDAVNAVSVVVTNDEATYLLKRPQDFSPADLGQALDLVRSGDLTELYRLSRVQVKDGRTAVPVKPGYNFNINKWSLYAPGGTYFLPINEITRLYINALLEAFEPEMGIYVLDERASFRPAGLGAFARRKGGHLHDDFEEGRVATIEVIEAAIVQGAVLEQGMVLQNLWLMSEALCLGGFVNFAKHENGWFEALGFRLEQMPAIRYLGAGILVRTALRATRRDAPIAFPAGLERDGQTLLHAYCPPYYATMRDAVLAVVESKFGPQGAYRGAADRSAWREPNSVSEGIPGPSDRAVGATIAYCEYIHKRYGRFPAHSAPFTTNLGYQATHVDVAFYERFYRPEALTDAQRRHTELWHASM